MSEPINTYVYAFKRFQSEGMTALEARRQFGDEEWNRAVLSCLMTEGVDSELWTLAMEAQKESCDEPEIEKAYALWGAGWTSEGSSEPGRVMSWYWRRPPRTKSRPGKLFRSTNQAFNAMDGEQRES